MMSEAASSWCGDALVNHHASIPTRDVPESHGRSAEDEVDEGGKQIYCDMSVSAASLVVDAHHMVASLSATNFPAAATRLSLVSTL